VSKKVFFETKKGKTLMESYLLLTQNEDKGLIILGSL
jgi:hypothetical protein